MPELTQEQTEAIERLKSALPYLRYAAKEAEEHGTPKLAIVGENADGGGKVCISFDLADFLKDIELLTGAAPQTPEDDIDAQALQFVQKHNIKAW